MNLQKMSNTALSILVFGIYLVIIGLIFLLAPNAVLSLIGLPPTHEVWAHLAGMLLLVLAFYYLMAAWSETRPFFQWTLYTRFSAIFVLIGFVWAGWIGPVVFLFWLGDLAGALWTLLALRKDALPPHPAQQIPDSQSPITETPNDL